VDRAEVRAGTTLRAISLGAAVVLLLVLVAGRVFYRQWDLDPAFGYDKVAGLGLAALLVALAPLLPRWRTEQALAVTATLATLAGVQAALLLTGVDVVYTIDAAGHRAIPAPARAAARVLLVGGSFAFGEGVADDETFAAHLAARHWPTVEIVNDSASGWGPAQALLAVLDALAAPTPPDVVIYAMIPDHQRRNVYRGSATGQMAPHLELLDDVLTPVDAEWAVARGAPLLARDAPIADVEVTWTVAHLEAMAAACRAAGVPFGVVLLPDERPVEPGVAVALGASGATVADLTRLPIDRFEFDHHPNAGDHHRIADALAASPVGMLVRAAAGRP
jgi:hypothetical protein